MGGLRPHRRRSLRGSWRAPRALAFALAGVLALLIGGLHPSLSGLHPSLSVDLLTVLPALALAALMLVRPYPGERAIARLRSRRTQRPRLAAGASLPGPCFAELAVHGGRLIAHALAGRAPPATLARAAGNC